MLDMEDRIYQNKNSVRACIGIIKTMNKVQKHKEEEEKKFKPEAEEYRNSTEYKKMVEELRKKDEDDDYRNDYDPKGYDLYEQSVSLVLNNWCIVERSHWQSFRICLISRSLQS